MLFKDVQPVLHSFIVQVPGGVTLELQRMYPILKLKKEREEALWREEGVACRQRGAGILQCKVT